MVCEFGNLQGIVGKYYANIYGECDPVCKSIEQHHWPVRSGSTLPNNLIARAVAIAEKIDTVVGIFGIGEIPNGSKDPFGLRRAVIGILRILT